MKKLSDGVYEVFTPVATFIMTRIIVIGIDPSSSFQNWLTV